MTKKKKKTEVSFNTWCCKWSQKGMYEETNM